MIRTKRAITAVSIGLAVAVFFLFLTLARTPVHEWPWFAFLIVAVLAALVAGLPWGAFYLGRWLELEGRHATFVVIAILLLLFVWFVWPTPYRYIMGGEAQVNRFTGARCAAGQSCW